MERNGSQIVLGLANMVDGVIIRSILNPSLIEHLCSTYLWSDSDINESVVDIHREQDELFHNSESQCIEVRWDYVEK